MARHAHPFIFEAEARNTQQLDELFRATGQGAAKAKEALPLTTKRFRAYGHRPTVRPQDLVSLELNVFLFTISRRIAAKDNE